MDEHLELHNEISMDFSKEKFHSQHSLFVLDTHFLAFITLNSPQFPSQYLQ